MKAHVTAMSILAGLVSLGEATPLRAQSAPGYRVTMTVALGAPDRWDYVFFDADSHRVFVAHGSSVDVVDGQDGRLLGKVTGFPGGTHGIAISTATGRGYTDDGRAGETGSFDLKTLLPGKHLKAGDDSDAVAFDPSSGRVYVVNGDAGTLTVVDPKLDSVVATVQIGGKLEFAVAGNNGKLYVNGAANKELVRVDTATNQVDARWPIPNCTSPHGLAIDRASHRLFASCVNQLLVVVNADTGTTLASLPIGAGTDAAAFDPVRKRIFSSNGVDGNLSIIQEKDPDTYISLGNITTARLARTMTVDPETGRLYLLAPDMAPATTEPTAAAPRPRWPPIVPGSLKLLFLDPVE